MKVTRVSDVKVHLIAGGGKCYTDIAARFCRSNKSVEEIIGSEYSKKLVEHIIKSGHLAATEFDTYIFGIEGASRVFEAQLIRKRMASYMISSGREDRTGYERELTLPDCPIYSKIHGEYNGLVANTKQIIGLLDSWYKNAVGHGVKPEDARYMMPQGSTKKIILAMNAHSLIDWFKIRCCNRAQTEIRLVANKILAICKATQPDLFAEAGPSCKSLGFCPEGEQCTQMAGKIMRLETIKQAVKENRFMMIVPTKEE